jgi:predicted MFS family arabinose efflux permease
MIAASGMYWLSALTAESSYAWHIMPALFITSFGLGLSFVPMTLTAVHKVAEDRAGVASALVNMAQQIGAALGLAVFTTISLTAASSMGGTATAGEALTYGYTTAFFAGAVILLAAAVIVILSVNTKQTQGTAGMIIRPSRTGRRFIRTA